MNKTEFKWIKGPSEEKILKAFEGKTIEENFESCVKNNYFDGIIKCVNGGLDVSMYVISTSSGILYNHNNIDINKYIVTINMNPEILEYLKTKIKLK